MGLYTNFLDTTKPPMLDHSIAGMVLGQYVTHCIHEKRATLSV